MSLTINVRENGNVVILDMSGRVTAGEAISTFRDEIRELLDSGHLNFVLNLADVSYIDSSGLGQFVGSYATITNRGGQLKLLNLEKRVDQLLQVTKMYTVFEAFKSEAAAVKSFSETRAGAGSGG